MGIGHHPLRDKLPEILQRVQGLLPLAQRVVIPQIAQMLAQDRLPTAHQAEGVFQIRPKTQQRRHSVKTGRQWQRIRDKAPGAAQHFPAGAQHRVIHALDDLAVMQQPAVSNAGQIL